MGSCNTLGRKPIKNITHLNSFVGFDTFDIRQLKPIVSNPISGERRGNNHKIVFYFPYVFSSIGNFYIKLKFGEHINRQKFNLSKMMTHAIFANHVKYDKLIFNDNCFLHYLSSQKTLPEYIWTDDNEIIINLPFKFIRTHDSYSCSVKFMESVEINLKNYYSIESVVLLVKKYR